MLLFLSFSFFILCSPAVVCRCFADVRCRCGFNFTLEWYFLLKLTTDASLFRGPVVGVVSSGRRCSLWDGVSQWHGVCSRCRFYFLFCMRKTAPMLRKNVGAVLAFPKHVADTACAWDSAAAMFPCAAGVAARALVPHPVARLARFLRLACDAGAVFSPVRYLFMVRKIQICF